MRVREEMEGDFGVYKFGLMLCFGFGNLQYEYEEVRGRRKVFSWVVFGCCGFVFTHAVLY